MSSHRHHGIRIPRLVVVVKKVIALPSENDAPPFMDDVGVGDVDAAFTVIRTDGDVPVFVVLLQVLDELGDSHSVNPGRCSNR